MSRVWDRPGGDLSLSGEPGARPPGGRGLGGVKGRRPMRIALFCSLVRPEEKGLLEAFRRRGVAVEVVHDRSAVLEVGAADGWRRFDAVLMRSLSPWQALHAAQLLQDLGLPVINPAAVIHTCADKLLTTAALVRAGVPTPRVRIAFS
ncbi:MAG: hypothetical protein C4312_06420, partial [Thermoflexus sp.]